MSASGCGVVYLAGPEVFLPDAAVLGKRKKEICKAYGFDARFPLDAKPASDIIGLTEVALSVFDICVAMMNTCDLLIANMTPFRGVSMDVGTAVELGYMHALGKPVFGYTNVVEDYDTRVMATRKFATTELVESFGLADNLMCEGPILRSGGKVVRCAVSTSDLLTSLEGFEQCVQQALQVFRASK